MQKITNICEKVGFSCDSNTGMVSRKLILQASEQNVNSVQYARPAAKRRSMMRKQSHLIAV